MSLSAGQCLAIAVAALAALAATSVTTIRQGNVGVTVLFGRYRRILWPGFNLCLPLVERVYRKISLQHRSAELEFLAITKDQANVDFKALLIYGVLNDDVETIKRAAFKFVDEKSFMQAMICSVEGSIRAFVATKRQDEVLALRQEIVDEVNAHIEHDLNAWGFHLFNLQINDISFDEAIVRSMAQVVATSNMRAAAENEAQAQYISKTRIADAEAHAKRVVAAAERDVEMLRGEGNAMLRQKMALGFVEAEAIMRAQGVDVAAMHYEMWLDAMKHIAAHSQGNILSFDGSMEGFEKTMKQMTLLGPVDKRPAAADNHAN